MSRDESSVVVRGVATADLSRVVAWLDSDQDPHVAVSHHGVGIVIGDYYVSITPQPPFNDGLRRGVVVVFEVREPRRAVGDEDNPHADFINGIDPDERDALQALLADVAPILDAWNGISKGCVTCSFHIDREPGPAVKRAKANYVPFERQPQVRGIEPATATATGEVGHA